MKKDVIYIDIEDDITSIIEKVKAAQVKIVALVPPKRIGALQSVVNLKLLQRAAQGVDKRVVLITNDPSLTNLAAGVSIPVAKNLQSKPEIAPISTLEIDDEDIINGEELSIGEHAATAPGAVPIVDEKPSAFTPTPAGPVAALAAANAPKKGPKIPSFDSFRKKLFIFGGLGLALIVFLVWATVFAPRAVIAITAKTTSYDINKALTLSPTATMDADTGSIKAVVKEVQKTNSVDFTATGKQDVGEKATGTITLVNASESTAIQVPAGSAFTTTSGRQFTSDTSVSVPGASLSGGKIVPGTIKVAATATAIGEEYNVGAQALVSNDVTVGARFDQATSGGSKRQITVVSDADVEAAKVKLTAQDAAAVKKELKSQFTTDMIVMDESFVATAGTPTVSPAVGAEAQGAKLTAESKYSMIGMLRDDLKKVLEADINSQLQGLPNQKIYDSGINKVSFGNFEAKEGGVYVALASTTGYVGPNIDSAQLAKQLSGKRSGEVQSQVQTIDGVESVDVKLSPFWVNKAPSEDKITIKFLIKNEAN